MKRCPACNTTYSDDSLKFCLSDGTALSKVADEEATVVRAKAPGFPTPGAASPKRGSSTLLKVIAVLVVLGIGALVVAGIAGAAFYYSMAEPTPTATPLQQATPRPTAARTPDLEKERLQDEIANIQRQLDDQKKDSRTSNSDDNDQRGSPITALVDSPNDGFLALRDRPDAERGERLVKIPHGAEVEIMNCEKNAVTISGRSGRWCQVEYNEVNGWVFDAWLDY